MMILSTSKTPHPARKKGRWKGCCVNVGKGCEWWTASKPINASDGVKDMTHEAKAKAKAKAMTHEAKAKAKDLTLRRHLYCNVNINKQQAYN